MVSIQWKDGNSYTATIVSFNAMTKMMKVTYPRYDASWDEWHSYTKKNRAVRWYHGAQPPPKISQWYVCTRSCNRHLYSTFNIVTSRPQRFLITFTQRRRLYMDPAEV